LPQNCLNDVRLVVASLEAVVDACKCCKRFGIPVGIFVSGFMKFWSLLMMG
jgi:hypothetical protein